MPTTTYKPIASTTLSSSVASYTFSSIPQTYTDLVLVCRVNNSSASYLGGRFNGDSGTNYSDTILWGATNPESFRYSNADACRFGYTMTANTSTKTSISHIMNYSNSTTNKSVVTRGNDTAAVGMGISLYRSTSPITSIQIFFSDGPSIAAGSTLTLYGIL